jgi:hypothetical protein
VYTIFFERLKKRGGIPAASIKKIPGFSLKIPSPYLASGTLGSPG